MLTKEIQMNEDATEVKRDLSGDSETIFDGEESTVKTMEYVDEVLDDEDEEEEACRYGITWIVIAHAFSSCWW
jgi:hypothetical protein